jgi:hypothetical protein
MIRKILLMTGVFFALAVLWAQGTIAAEKNDQIIIINKSTNQLAFYDQGELVKEFSVATGLKPSYTPEGSFKIVNKIKNRPYYKDKIPGGDPKNPLGDRWLGINAKETWGTTYAIHGNNNAKSIGTYASAGCIRMHNEEVRWLFEQVKVDTPVIITSSELTFNQIAEANQYSLSSAVIKPLMKRDDTVFLPLRAMESLGATVSWEEQTKTATVIMGENVVILSIESGAVFVNGIAIIENDQFHVVQGRTMVSQSFLSGIFQLSSEWIAQNAHD